MSRTCTTCHHLKRPEIDRRLAAGEPTAQVARDYDINPSSLHRHRANCLKLASANAIMKEAARGTAAMTLLPSKEDLGRRGIRTCAAGCKAFRGLASVSHSDLPGPHSCKSSDAWARDQTLIPQ
jgi:hypothetical protein